MPYIRETCVAGDVIEISKFYSYRVHTKGEKRSPKKIPSSLAQKRANDRKAERDLRRLMNANFKRGDYLLRLDFYEHKPKDSKEMQEMTAKAVRKIRAEFMKRGMTCKYIFVKEVGQRGGRHVHMMLNKCDPEILMKCWTYGQVHFDILTSRSYEKIAAYFIKYENTTFETEGVRVGKRWYGSRTLKKPKVKKEYISANKFRAEPAFRKGYNLQKDSERHGFSEITGYEYAFYSLIREEHEGKGVMRC